MAERKRLEGRVALITGGGRGIGQAIARAYAAEGARLALAARTSPELEETASRIRAESGAEVAIFVADVSQREQVDAAVAETLGRYGAIDVLVNNAGNAGPVGRCGTTTRTNGHRLSRSTCWECFTAATPCCR